MAVISTSLARPSCGSWNRATRRSRCNRPTNSVMDGWLTPQAAASPEMRAGPQSSSWASTTTDVRPWPHVRCRTTSTAADCRTAAICSWSLVSTAPDISGSYVKYKVVSRAAMCHNKRCPTRSSYSWVPYLYWGGVRWCPGREEPWRTGAHRRTGSSDLLRDRRHASTQIHDRNITAIGTIRGVSSLTTDFRRESVPRVPLIEVWTERHTGLQRRHTWGQKPGRISERLRSGISEVGNAPRHTCLRSRG
jgi:hypothetical protein